MKIIKTASYLNKISQFDDFNRIENSNDFRDVLEPGSMNQVSNRRGGEWTHNGHKCDIRVNDDEGKYYKVITPSGKILHADIDPYDNNARMSLELWIDLGYPPRPSNGNWNYDSLKKAWMVKHQGGGINGSN